MIIYKVINIVNGKCYIGKTSKKLNLRKNEHKCCAYKEIEGEYFSDATFYKAIRKYGLNNFQWEIIKVCENELMLGLMETFMIMVHHSHVSEGGYNLTWGGEGSCGYKHTDKAKQKIKEKRCKQLSPNKGIKFSDSWKQNLSKAHMGKNTWSKGRLLSEEMKKIWGKQREKTWETILPNGQLKIIKGLKSFCRENNLNYYKMLRKSKKFSE